MEMDTLCIALRGVCAYRGLREEPVMEQMSALLSALSAGKGEQALEHYTRVFYLLRQEGFAGLGDWLADRLRYSEEPYALLAEQGGSDAALEGAARWDVECFAQLAKLECDKLIDAMGELLPGEYQSVLTTLPRWSAGAPFDFDGLTQGYRTGGTGMFARYRAFVWQDGALTPVARPDCPAEEELLGYESQRATVVANTRAMLEGHAVNNILLYGDSGTGKSATVKSLLAVEGFDALRVVELQKESLGDMPALIRALGQRRQKFILFIDDLAFDQDDRTYSVLKTVLEGGLERRPANVAIYATSNRRHLVRQTFSDRAGDEVDAAETIQEKTALADRFGVRVLYLPLNKADYLALVDKLAAQAGIEMEREQLHARAVDWEVHHGGRTPRTAQQFVTSLKA